MIVNRRTGWRKQAYLTCYYRMDFLLDVHLPLEMGIYGMHGKSHEAIWRQTYPITPLLRRQHKCCRLRRGSDRLCLYGIRRVGIGKISASWENSKNHSTPEYWRGMVFFPISRPTIVGHLTCSEEPYRSVVWILLRVGQYEIMRENGEVGRFGWRGLGAVPPFCGVGMRMGNGGLWIFSDRI